MPTSPAGAARFDRIEALINPLAGHAGPAAVEEAIGIFRAAGVTARVTAAGPEALVATLEEIRRRRPQLLVIVAGDGTARAAAEFCGMTGPLLAPLPGGTMNMLPHALYGDADWRTALARTLEHGVTRDVGGGVIGGRTFYVAAMLGSTAAFAPAREAARRKRLNRAIVRARLALRQAMGTRLRFRFARGETHEARALTLICPLISQAMDSDREVLEAVAVDPAGSAEALRLGARVALSQLIGDWRADPAVHVWPVRRGLVSSRRPISALLDGEPVTLSRQVRFRYAPRAFRAFAPPPKDEAPA